jgi:hypothetical protein
VPGQVCRKRPTKSAPARGFTRRASTKRPVHSGFRVHSGNPALNKPESARCFEDHPFGLGARRPANDPEPRTLFAAQERIFNPRWYRRLTGPSRGATVPLECSGSCHPSLSRRARCFSSPGSALILRVAFRSSGSSLTRLYCSSPRYPRLFRRSRRDPGRSAPWRQPPADRRLESRPMRAAEPRESNFVGIRTRRRPSKPPASSPGSLIAPNTPSRIHSGFSSSGHLITTGLLPPSR